MRQASETQLGAWEHAECLIKMLSQKLWVVRLASAGRAQLLLGMDMRRGKAWSDWALWLWVVATIPLGMAVAWVVHNFSPIAPDALAVPVACAVVVVATLALPRATRGKATRKIGAQPDSKKGTT